MDEFTATAREAAMKAGELLRESFGRPLHVDANEAHDVKLELDRRAQATIEEIILARFPHHAIYGEEGMRGDQGSEHQWIIDPIDGTVNLFYGIPHFAISIALRSSGRIVSGVIYDPMRDEMWIGEENSAPTLNGSPIRVSDRSLLAEAMVSVGVSKTREGIESSLLVFQKMIRSVKKCRMMGSAALDIAYVACGRLDAYIEGTISLWDIAAGVLLVESAGGSVTLTPRSDKPDKYSIVASSGRLDLPS